MKRKFNLIVDLSKFLSNKKIFSDVGAHKLIGLRHLEILNGFTLIIWLILRNLNSHLNFFLLKIEHCLSFSRK